MHLPAMVSRSRHLSHSRRPEAISMIDMGLKKNPRPSDAQWAAIGETERHMLVSAGAGTGKTFTVVSHILYLMGVETRECVHSPALALDQIAAITYTNKAAAEL